MASLIPGFEYDIFISYRQKDNKGEKWVSEFVNALETELESTFKEDISVYFDIDPHEGLLETYDVGASLKKKLKCLVFIPIISRTYCDPKSFAWEYEFKAFVEQASSDQFGLKLNLPNGNVVSRVLPVRIHDLDITDQKLCESVLGGMLRGVDFVYKSTGVNRPLRPLEERPHDNLNKTYYRDQINKVANSIRDIIQVLVYSGETVEKVTPLKEKVRVQRTSRKLVSKKMVPWILLVLFVLLCISGIYSYTRIHNKNINKKTIAIIPMTIPAGDADLESNAVGAMWEIIKKLQNIKSLTVKGYLSTYYYLNTKMSVDDLRKKLNVNYLVLILLNRTGQNINMKLSLTQKNDDELWSQDYIWNNEQLLADFTKIVQTIGGRLDIDFTSQDILAMEKDLTKNYEAYGYYLTASANLITAMGNKYPATTGFRYAIESFDKAIEIDPEFANAYARRAIARSWGIYNEELDTSNIKKCLSDIIKASIVNPNLPDVQIARGFYYYYCDREYSKALMYFNNAAEKDPENYLPRFYMAMVHRAMGNWKDVRSLLSTVIPEDPQDPLVLTNIGLCYEYLHDYDSALIYHEKAIKVNREWPASYMNKYYTLILSGKIPEARSLLDSLSKNSDEKYAEEYIKLDMYQNDYLSALTRAADARSNDFEFKGLRSLYLANICTLLGSKADADQHFNSAVEEFNLELKADTGNADLYGNLGLALAGTGNTDALAIGERAVRIAGRHEDKNIERAMILIQAEIYTKLGKHTEAFKLIDESLANPSLISTKFLQFDPLWYPLRKKPQFEALINKYERIKS